MNKFCLIILLIIASLSYINFKATATENTAIVDIYGIFQKIGISNLIAQELEKPQINNDINSDNELGEYEEVIAEEAAKVVLDKLTMVEANFAELQTLDKITGRISELRVRVGEEVIFERIIIRNNICLKNPKQEQPSSKVHLTIIEEGLDKTKSNIFSGWMFSSLPALNPVQHPVYDVWLKECLVN